MSVKLNILQMQTNSTNDKSSIASKTPFLEFVCVEYPGVGKNVDKMIECLGGIKKISEVNFFIC